MAMKQVADQTGTLDKAADAAQHRQDALPSGLIV
jgi:hypothetical protein